MEISPELFTMGFVTVQGAIFYETYRHLSPERERRLPPYLRMMADPFGGIAPGAISPLFVFAQEDLEAVREGRQWNPRPEEVGTSQLAAYEAAQAFSLVALTAIEAMLLYGPHDSPPEPVVSSLRDMSLNLRLAEMMHYCLGDQLGAPRSFFPLQQLRGYAFDQHDCAIGKVLKGELARRQAEFPSSLEISLEVQEATNHAPETE